MQIELIREPGKWYQVKREFTTWVNGYESQAFLLENGERVVSAQVMTFMQTEEPFTVQDYLKLKDNGK